MAPTVNARAATETRKAGRRAGRRLLPGRSLVRRFVFEFVVVVAGVLVALALSAWFEGRRDAASEQAYLALLSRDLDRTVEDLASFVEFESRQLEDAALAARGLSAGPPATGRAEVAAAMARLMTRQTLTLKNAAYEDLLNTGHLNLIRDAALRDRIVDFYQFTALRFDVINRNNTFFVDQIYNERVILSGLIQARLSSNHPDVEREAAAVALRLGTGMQPGIDRLWELPPDAPEWPMVRSALLARTLVSQQAQTVGAGRLAAARELKAAVDTARHD